ncbi:hypothetical protein IWZ01DRAFT_544844 [Phyllosticta capitalensis]
MAPNFQQTSKLLDFTNYRNYMTAVWSHFSDQVVKRVAQFRQPASGKRDREDSEQRKNKFKRGKCCNGKQLTAIDKKLARNQNTKKQARKDIFKIPGLLVITDPDFRHTNKPLDLGNYTNYMPALWGHCSNKATEPARICADCVKGNGLFGSYKQVVGENGALWGGACTSRFAPSGTKRCSLSANYDPQYRKKRKAAEPDEDAIQQDNNSKRQRMLEIQEEKTRLMTAMNEMAARLNELHREEKALLEGVEDEGEESEDRDV